MRGAAALLALGLVAASCDTGGDGAALPERTPLSSPTASDSLVIGLIATTSGREAWRGEDAFEGADAAVHALNRAAGDERFELFGLDDRGDPREATRLVAELASSERTVGIVYAGPPEGLAAPEAEAALAEAGIPAIICYGDLYGARRLQPHVFQTAPSYLWEARTIARYLLRDRRYVRIGALVEESLSGRTALRSLQAGLIDVGGRRAAAATYAPGAELAPVLERLRRRRVEALVIQGSPAGSGRILRALDAMGARYRSTAAARTASAPRRARRARLRGDAWRPQVASFDEMISPQLPVTPAPGTVAADSYARGAHYLPVPSLARFAATFSDWWDYRPLGWEQRAYDAVRMIGWAAQSPGEGDLARRLESLRGRRYGGLDIVLGPDDHTSVGETTVGLWVVPRPGARVPERPLPEALPWVPLARGFSIDGTRTDILPEDWRYLFRNAPPPNAPAPKVRRMRFGMATPRRDPIH